MTNKAVLFGVVCFFFLVGAGCAFISDEDKTPFIKKAINFTGSQLVCRIISGSF